MQPIRDLPAGSLTWVSDSADRTLRRLTAGEATVAELRWSTGLASEGATVATSEGVWALDRRGLLDKQVAIEAQAGIGAVYSTEGWQGGGELVTEVGSRFAFVPTGVMGTRWAFTDADGAAWAGFLVERRRIFRAVEVARIEPAGVGRDEIGLLVAIGSWLAVLARRDLASGVGAV